MFLVVAQMKKHAEVHQENLTTGKPKEYTSVWEV